MTAGARSILQNWVQRLYGPLTRLTGRSYSRATHTHIPVKFTLLGKGLVLSSLSVLAMESYSSKSKHAEVHASIKVEDIQEQADYLHGNGETDKLYEFLSQYKNSEDPELLWRLARASRDLAHLSKTAPDVKKRLVYESRDLAKKALELNESCSPAHKWYGICLSDVGDYEGTKVKIGNSYIIREHFQRAIELNPKDATTIHLIGLWCYMFAELPWYQTKIAAALFAAPPTATFEEALPYFEKAEEGKLLNTFLQLKKKEQALQWLQKAREYPLQTEEDKEVHKEATDLLKSLGEKV
ncbi:PREDICTED: regulator of microtubule dynamics protein 1 isoform X2 [Nanorana parkeri]|uniref:regulator of microtubule dynamics protein 1 isoform X2 n=1 Tax=Nanorana parkeri TaxID=125878 RepID=UPI0008542457|nr:PREDICTED: regulator of microtubule dynamics protein 1 isoform X2 [Nanorana parkeri]